MPNKTTRKTSFAAPAGAGRKPREERSLRARTQQPVEGELLDHKPRRAPRTPKVDASNRARHKEVPGKPERLHKLLAQSGIGSRREMEELIAEGRVNVNGETAQVGQSASPGDRIKVNGKLVHLKFSNRLPRVIIYHKPEGEIVSRDDPEGRTSVFDKLPVLRGSKWLAIGRLDFNTCGLLIFTTSGELANRLTHPRFEVEREYAVRVMGELTEQQGRALVNGVELPDGPAHFDILETQGGTGSNNWYRVVVREGRNRLVRRMFEHVGLTVSRLMRVRFGMINLPPRLKRGQHLELTEAQTRSVLDWLSRTGAPVADAEEEPPAPTRSKRQPAAPAPSGRKPRAPATARAGSPRSGPAPRGDRGRKR